MSTTVVNPRPISQRDRGRRPDIETELAEHYHVEFTYLTSVPMDQFDMDRSLKNQARFEPLDEDTVELYREGVERGDPFPAVIAWRPGRSANAKLVMIDGNHRGVAHSRADAPIDVYEVDRATKPQTVSLMTFAFNTRHGRPTSEQERISHALYLIASGASAETAGTAVNVPIRVLKREMVKAKADERAREAGLDLREWDRIPQSTKSRLLGVTTDEGFLDAARLVFKAGLSTEEAMDLVTMLNTSRSGTKQRAMVKSESERYAERIQEMGAGVLNTNKAGGRPASPRARLGMLLGQVLALPQDNATLIRSYTDNERTDVAKRVLDASERLADIALAIDPGLR